MPLYTAITQEGTVYLETRPDWYVMSTAGFEPTISTARRCGEKGPMNNLKGRNDCTLDMGIVNVCKWSCSVTEIS